MLGKLIKYDLKSTSRLLVLIHVFLVILSVLGRVFVTGRITFDMEDVDQFLLTLAMVLYIILFAGASFATYIVIAVRFYKNLFSDEGYLTNTLPVRKSTLLFTKTLSGTIWALIDILLIGLCSYLLFAIPAITDAIAPHWDEFLTLLGFEGRQDFTLFMVYLAVSAVIGAFSSVVMIEASVVLGQLFNGHKVLGAVVSYFVLTTILSVISTVVLSIQGVLNRSYLIQDPAYDVSGFDFASYIRDIINSSVCMCIVVTLILYLMSYFIMRKKINLS